MMPLSLAKNPPFFNPLEKSKIPKNGRVVEEVRLFSLNIPFIPLYFPKKKKEEKTRRSKFWTRKKILPQNGIAQNYINIDYITVADCAGRARGALLREREEARHAKGAEKRGRERGRAGREGDAFHLERREVFRGRRVAPRALNIHADLSSADCHL